MGDLKDRPLFDHVVSLSDGIFKPRVSGLRMEGKDLSLVPLDPAFEKPPADVINWAMANMLLSSMAIHEILDSSMSTEPCLCCVATSSKRVAGEIDTSIRTVLRYFSADSYSASDAFRRLISGLLKDINAREELTIKAHYRRAGRHLAPAAICKSLNETRGLCVVAPACRPLSLWVYSTPLGRKLLRYATRACRKIHLITKVTILTEDTEAIPRFAYRVYVFSVVGAAHEKSDEKVESISHLSKITKFWTAIAEMGAAFQKKEASGIRDSGNSLVPNLDFLERKFKRRPS